MKLIIDIDDNVFTRLFDNGVDTSSEDREVIDRAVRNGVPYKDSLQGDLISREALKKDFEERNKACDKWIANAKDEETKIRADATKHFICEVIMTINNAPTVPLPDFKEGYKQAIIDGKTNFSRPQGEWKMIGSIGLAYTCNICGEVEVVNSNFCPNCGADMRKGGAE